MREFQGVDQAGEGVAEGVRYTIALLPALCVFVGATIIRRYPLSVSEFARIQTLLSERRTATASR